MNYKLYTRCSTEEQKNGFSHEYQKSGLLGNSKLSKYNFSGIYSDQISGTVFKRPELDRLLKDCKFQKNIDFVFIYKWDRFGRNITEALNLIRDFRHIGVEVNCPDQWIDFNDSNWPILLAIHLGIAQSESIKISERTKDGLDQARRAGYYVATAPFGYKRQLTKIDGKQRKMMIIDDLKAPIVRRIFKKVSEGEVVSSLAKKYKLSRSTTYDMLKNIAYAGFVVAKAYKKNPLTIVKGKHPAIVSIKLYNKVQEVLSGKHNYPTRRDMDFFFAKDILRCYDTDRHVTAYWSKGRSNSYPYYSTPGIKGSVRNANKTHAALLSSVSHLSASNLPKEMMMVAREVIYGIIGQDDGLINSIELNISKFNKQLEKINDDYVDGQINGRSYSMLTEKIYARLSELDNDHTTLLAQKKQISAQIETIIDVISNLGQTFKSLNNGGRSKVLKAIFPEGISVCPKYSLRTARVNKAIDLFYCNSAFYESVGIKKADKILHLSALGEGVNDLRTDLFLLSQAFSQAV